MLKLLASVSPFANVPTNMLYMIFLLDIMDSKYMTLVIPPQNLVILYLETTTIALAGPMASPGWFQSPGAPTLAPHILELYVCTSMSCHSITFNGRKS